MRTNQGQSLIELVMVLPVFIAFWAAIVWFSRVVIITIVLMHTARHGIFWLAYHEAPEMNPAYERHLAETECRAFLLKEAPLLERSRIHVTVNPGDQWQPLGPKSLIDIPGIIELTINLKSALRTARSLISFPPASVEVVYDMPAPSLLRAIPGFPQTIPLRGYSACYR